MTDPRTELQTAERMIGMCTLRAFNSIDRLTTLYWLDRAKWWEDSADFWSDTITQQKLLNPFQQSNPYEYWEGKENPPFGQSALYSAPLEKIEQSTSCGNLNAAACLCGEPHTAA